MGSGKDFFDNKPANETILGEISRRYTARFSPQKITKSLEEEAQQRRSVSRFNTDDERAWLKSEAGK